MYYTEMSKTQTETIKEERSNQKYYKKEGNIESRKTKR